MQKIIKTPEIIFLLSMSIVLFSFITVMFPALILSFNTVSIPQINSASPHPFEVGVWSAGVVLSGGIILVLAISYDKVRLISQFFAKILSFEISSKITIISLVVLIGVYVLFASNELYIEENFEDYVGVQNRLDGWSIESISSFDLHVRYFLLTTSMDVFGNYKIIPFLASIALLITTFLITKTITQKRFAGIVSVIILLQSPLFQTYDTTVTYTNFWTLFYLISLYIVYRFWQASPIFYILSIFSKMLTVMFLPMSVYFILKSNLSKNQKAILLIITVGIILMGGIVLTAINSVTDGMNESFNAKEFQVGFTSFAYQLRSDGVVMLFMIPLIVGLYMVSKNGTPHGESIMVLLAGMLLIAPILTGFTNQTNQPYRFIPLVVFFAIGIGVLLSKRQVE